MATFTDKQQKITRDVFIGECFQKAWGAACHADWMSKQLEEQTEEYLKLQEEEKAAERAIAGIDLLPDYHTVENREKRKALTERTKSINATMRAIAMKTNEGVKLMQNLLKAVDQAIALAQHAKTFTWKESEPEPAE